MNQFAIVAATLAFALAACTAETGNPTNTDPAEPTRPAATTPPASTGSTEHGTIGDVDEEMLDALMEQASEEAGVSTDEITVISAESVTWSDGSLGCPEPGMAYTQALVPGYRVVLDVAGEEIHYHAGSDGSFFACDDPQESFDSPDR